jgi:hypothetical protein
MRVGYNKRTITHNETRAHEIHGRAACLLESADPNDRWLYNFNGIGKIPAPKLAGKKTPQAQQNDSFGIDKGSQYNTNPDEHHLDIHDHLHACSRRNRAGRSHPDFGIFTR